jgi:hypothetical protein
LKQILQTRIFSNCKYKSNILRIWVFWNNVRDLPIYSNTEVIVSTGIRILKILEYPWGGFLSQFCRNWSRLTLKKLWWDVKSFKFLRTSFLFLRFVGSPEDLKIENSHMKVKISWVSTTMSYSVNEYLQRFNDCKSKWNKKKHELDYNIAMQNFLKKSLRSQIPLICTTLSSQSNRKMATK